MKKKHAKVFDVGNLTTIQNQTAKPEITENHLNSPKKSFDFIFSGCMNPVTITDSNTKPGQAEKQDFDGENENDDALRKKHYLSPEESLRSN